MRFLLAIYQQLLLNRSCHGRHCVLWCPWMLVGAIILTASTVSGLNSVPADTTTTTTTASSNTPERALHAPALLRLNTGATRPKGWLLRELTLQARGLSGQLPYFWRYFNRSAWMIAADAEAPQPEQFIPYYLNGLFLLSYQVQDTNLIALRERYVSHILSQQHIGPDGAGWLGRNVTTDTPTNYWSKYDAVLAFEAYAEAAPPQEASRVMTALIAHQRQFWKQVQAHAPALNESRWGFERYAEALVGLQWLLDRQNQTHDKQHHKRHDNKKGHDTSFLWDLMEAVRVQADSTMAAVDHAWQDFFAEMVDPFKYKGKVVPPNDKDPTIHLLRHGVDIGEAMKIGALWWRVSGSAADKANPSAALRWAEAFLHMPDGMYWADEEVYGLSAPSRGTETCSVVETMFSMRTVYEITGNISFMDRLERLAFNALPAALWPDVTANVYHHGSNQLQAAHGPWAYDLFFCCSANVHQGWPKFMLSAVQTRTDGSGAIVVSGYAPSTSNLVTSQLAAREDAGGEGDKDSTRGGSTSSDANMVVTVSGTYPFADNATVMFSKSAAIVDFRVPCWTKGAKFTIGKNTSSVAAPPCAFYRARNVPADTPVLVVFENDIRVHEWKKSALDGQSAIAGGGIEVHRGPLLYALRPASDVQVQPPADPAHPNIRGRQVHVSSNASWAYAIDPKSLQFQATNHGVVPEIPFDDVAPPAVSIMAKGRLVPEWAAGKTVSGGTGTPLLPHSPLNSTHPLEDIVLVPYGATNIRISVFPQLVL